MTALRLQPPLPSGLHLQPFGIRHRQDFSLLSLKIILIDHFQADDSLIVSSRETQHLAGQVAVGVKPLIILIHFNSGQVVLPDPVPHCLLHIAPDSLHGRIFLHTLSHIFLGQIQFLAENPYDLLRVLQLIMYHGHRADRLVVRKHFSVAVQDPPPGCLDAPLSLVKLRGHPRIMLRLPHAQVHESAEQENQDSRTDKKNRQYLLSVKYFIVVRQHKKPHKKGVDILYSLFYEVMNFFS